VLTRDEPMDLQRVAARFAEVSAELPGEIVSFVRARLAD
jgi:hypothetical protein